MGAATFGEWDNSIKTTGIYQSVGGCKDNARSCLSDQNMDHLFLTFEDTKAGIKSGTVRMYRG